MSIRSKQFVYQLSCSKGELACDLVAISQGTRTANVCEAKGFESAGPDEFPEFGLEYQKLIFLGSSSGASYGTWSLSS